MPPNDYEDSPNDSDSDRVRELETCVKAQMKVLAEAKESILLWKERAETFAAQYRSASSDFNQQHIHIVEQDAKIQHLEQLVSLQENGTCEWCGCSPVAQIAICAPCQDLLDPTILADVVKERQRQDEQWGGPEHDDSHDVSDWLSFIEGQTFKSKTYESRRSWTDRQQRFVKIAALAIAAIESGNRRSARESKCECPPEGHSPECSLEPLRRKFSK